jgi:hypothetical protein
MTTNHDRRGATLHPDPFDGGGPADAGTCTPPRGLDDSLPEGEVAERAIQRRLRREVAAAGIPVKDVSADDLGAVAGALIAARDGLLREVKALVAQADRVGMGRVNTVLEAAGLNVCIGRTRCSVDINVPNVQPAAPRGVVPARHLKWVETYLKTFPENAGLDAVAMYRDFAASYTDDADGSMPLTFAEFDAALFTHRVNAAKGGR